MAALAAALLVAVTLAAAPVGGHAQTPPESSESSTPTATPTDSTSATATATVTATAGTSTDTPTPTILATESPAPTVTPTPFVSGVPCATDDPSNERVERSERHGDNPDDQGEGDEFRSGNGQNLVIVHNCTDNRLRVRAAIQLNTIPGHVVKPLNEAYAEGSCMACQTLAIALQIDLYSADHAGDVEPQNYAIAINTGCTDCVTVARAVQYVQPEENPNDVSRDISDAADDLSDELTSIQEDPSITLPEAESRLNAVLTRFAQLGGTLNDQRDEKDAND
jgi:hypothetical protein